MCLALIVPGHTVFCLSLLQVILFFQPLLYQVTLCFSFNCTRSLCDLSLIILGHNVFIFHCARSYYVLALIVPGHNVFRFHCDR